MAGVRRLVRRRISPAVSSTATASMSAEVPLGRVKVVSQAGETSPEMEFSGLL